MQAAIQGFGVGLRPEHYADFLQQPQRVDWLEILTDNYLVPGGKPLHYLQRIRRDYPIVMHGVAMNIGSVDVLDFDYLRAVKTLADNMEAQWISDHLCWTGVNGARLHDLLPLPYTDEAVEHVSERIMRVQDFFGRRLVIENVSAYLCANTSSTNMIMSECEFLSTIAEKADCDLLVDINNIYVSARNNHFDAVAYLQKLPARRIRQLHLAGHSDLGDHCIDTHDQPVCAGAWNLYARALQLWGHIPTMIERDDNIPALQELLDELAIARRLHRDINGAENTAGANNNAAA